MDSFYRRLFWALGAGVVCLVAGWILKRRHRNVETAPADASSDLTVPGKRERLVLSEDIRLGQTGSVSYRGSVWSARNEAGRDLKVGEQVLVERVEPTHTIVVTAAGGVVERH